MKKLRHSKTALLIGIPLLILALAAAVFFLKGFVRDTIIVPLMYTGWYIRRGLSFFSQKMLWTLSIFIVSIIAIMRFPAREKESEKVNREEYVERGRIAILTSRMLGFSHRSNNRSGLARYLGSLLSDPDLNIPPDVRDHLISGMESSEEVNYFIRFIKKNDRIHQSLSRIEAVVQYLEERLEVDFNEESSTCKASD